MSRKPGENVRRCEFVCFQKLPSIRKDETRIGAGGENRNRVLSLRSPLVVEIPVNTAKRGFRECTDTSRTVRTTKCIAEALIAPANYTISTRRFGGAEFMAPADRLD
jgi:hypothetical protein